jgi:hypothetical protein
VEGCPKDFGLVFEWHHRSSMLKLKHPRRYNSKKEMSGQNE